MSRLFGSIFQNGYVVRDLDAAMAHWTKAVGVGPFFVARRIAFETIEFRGRLARIEMAAALAYSGEIQIELIQPLSDAPSIYSEFLEAGGTGLHHVGVMTDTFDTDLARLAAADQVVVQGGRTLTGTRFAYFESDAAFPGSMVEVIEATDGIRRYFNKVREAARDWDGSEPVRMR